MNALLVSLMLLGPCPGGQCARPRVVQRPAPVARAAQARPLKVRRPLFRLRFPNVG